MGIFGNTSEAQNSGPDATGLSPLTNRLITDALTEMDLRYFTDSDGDVGAGWDGYAVYFFRMGKQEEILNCRIMVRRKFDVSEVSRLEVLCNAWNRDKLWPKAYVRVEVDEDGAPTEAQVYGEVVTDLEYGATPLQLRQLLSCALGSGRQLADAVNADTTDTA